MAKKRTTAKRRTKRSSKGPVLTQQFLKIVSALAILVLLVLGAGFLVRYLIGQPHEAPTTTALRPQQEKRYTVPPAPPKPTYEVFTKNDPPPKPLTRLPQLPGDHPPVVAIIIDDIGYDRKMADRFLSLDVPITFSLLPYGPFNRKIIDRARTKGMEIMLHLPMEPNEYPSVKPGPGALLSAMSPDALIDQLNTDLDQLTGLKGVNNHMGSRISTSPEQMRQIFSILKKRGLYYIDSRTTAETTAMASAQLLQLPFAERDIFIDHFDDPAFIRGQFEALIRRARKQGFAVGIGHPHETTYEVMAEVLPELKSQVTLVPASMVVQRSMMAQAASAQARR